MTFLVFFIAYFLTINFSFPLSKLITLYQLEGLLEPIGIKVNQLLVAVIFIYCYLFPFKRIGVLLKPFLKKIVSLLKMTKFIRLFIRFDFYQLLKESLLYILLFQ